MPRGAPRGHPSDGGTRRVPVAPLVTPSRDSRYWAAFDTLPTLIATVLLSAYANGSAPEKNGLENVPSAQASVAVNDVDDE
jgi:hypothetical protein